LAESYNAEQYFPIAPEANTKVGTWPMTSTRRASVELVHY